MPKYAHRLGDQFELDPAQQAVLSVLLLRGPQTPGELRSRAGRMHPFASVELVEAVLGSLGAHRFGALVERLPREAGRREARWGHLLGDAPLPTSAASRDASTSPAATGLYRTFHDAVLAGDWDAAVAQLSDEVVFLSPAVHRPYEGRDATAMVLRAVATVLEDFAYVDVLDVGDRAGLVFRARVGDRQVQGWDYLRFDDVGRIIELTVMIRPLSGLMAVVEAMQEALASLGAAPPPRGCRMTAPSE